MQLMYDVFSQMWVTLRDPSHRHKCMWHLAGYISWTGAITELWISLVQYVFTLIHWHRKQWHSAGHVTLRKCGILPQRRYTQQIASTPDPKWPMILLPVESPITTRSMSVWSETTILIKKWTRCSFCNHAVTLASFIACFKVFELSRFAPGIYTLSMSAQEICQINRFGRNNGKFWFKLHQNTDLINFGATKRSTPGKEYRNSQCWKLQFLEMSRFNTSHFSSRIL
jgi:hypothetical protein